MRIASLSSFILPVVISIASSGSFSEVHAAEAEPNGGGRSPARPIVSITRVVGEVGEYFVTSREVRMNQAIEQVLNSPKTESQGILVLSGLEKSFPAEVSQVLDEWVVFLEAKSLSSQPAQRGDVEKILGQIEDKLGQKAEWRDLEPSAVELRKMIERKLVAQEFERLKSDPRLAPVSDDDALAYYKKNRLRFGSLPFETFKDNIKAFLVKQQTQRRLAEWHEILRRKYKVRNFISG